MPQIRAGAREISQDEPAFNLSEVNLQVPGKKGWRRYQIVTVVRGDKLADHMKDLGPRGSFKVEQFRILGGVVEEKTGRIEILHTVGELTEIADHLRHNPLQHRHIVGGNLLERYAKYLEKRKNGNKRISITKE